MRSFQWVFGIVWFCWYAGAAALQPEGTMVLPAGQPADYTIVIPEFPTKQERFAAEWVAEHLRVLFQASFPVVCEPAGAGKRLISIGNTRQAAEAGVAEFPGEQSYRLAVRNDELYLLGGSRGPFYAAAAWLEEDLGVRWYAPELPVTYPKAPCLQITPRHWTPPFAVREPLYWTVMEQSEWALFNRLQPLSHHLVLPEEAGVAVGNGEYFVHTYFKMIPAEKYFATHPEYFPLRDGVRRPSTPYEGQLCYTNLDIPKLMAEQLRQAIRRRPELRIFSVSANDTLIQQCECQSCATLIRDEGITGAQLELSNRVAKLLEDEFPDIRLTMLAYTHSQAPPPTVSPRQGVEIFYAPYSHQHNPTATLLPIQELPAVVAELDAWRERGARMLFWDYSDFDVTPPMLCPSFDAQDTGLRFLAARGIDGVFMEGSHTYPGSLDALKSWVYAQKLWNPAWETDRLIEEFIDAYYGAAAPEMKQYVALQRQAWNEFYRLNQDRPTPFDLSAAQLEALRQLLQQAEEKCASSLESLSRLRAEWLPFLTHTLARNPRLVGVENYARDLTLAEQLLAELPDSPLHRSGIVERWRGKLAWAQTPMEPGAYSAGALRVWPPHIPLAELVDDPTVLNADRKAVRQKAGSDWGVQWNFDTFVDRMIPKQEYVIRLRMRSGNGRAPVPEQPVYRIRVHIFGDEARSAGSGAFSCPAADGTYRWVTLGRLKVEHPTATGCLYTLLPASMTAEESLWFDWLELIPCDEYQEQEEVVALPLIVI